ncbi:LppU/SCO3897 family protein [Streptomyces iconiensis]|uniref:Serine/threonine protein kinase n=1 Tax=Streptomyces iconiensis TaxID=1384038 RepID=A0ABT6ZZW1_9ACTN|nr:hypothetical protein [Streptomyces iconiensis]MDJ1134617.1 hypothetical protein [Streptomyces iconiensis]
MPVPVPVGEGSGGAEDTGNAGDIRCTGDTEVGGTSGSGAAGGASGPGGRAEGEGLDPDSPKERARRGRWRLVVAGALFATLILPKVISSADYTDPAAAQPSPSGSYATGVPSYPTTSPSGGPSGGPTLPSSPTSPLPTSSELPSPPSEPAPGAGATGDPKGAAFRSVEAGQCLTVHSNGRSWSRPAPSAATRVDCGSDRAYVRVTAVRETGGTCPSGNGRATWSGGGKDLCLTRQFRTDQCLLAETASGEVRAALMSAPACSTKRPSGRYDRLLTITGVHDDDTPCRRDSGDRTPYWTWKVDGGERVLCATEATGAAGAKKDGGKGAG